MATCNVIPTVHLDRAFDPDQVQELQRAAFEVGFFYLDSHGIDQQLLRDVLSESKSLFDLPLSAKKGLADNAMNRGYTAMGEQTLDPKSQTRGDTKEGYYIGRHIPADDPLYDPSKLRGPNQWPSKEDCPHFQSIMEQYFRAASSVARKVIQAIAVALELDQNYFDRYFDHPMVFLRLIHYEQSKSEPEQGIFACGAHSDWGMITLLLTDKNSGLQILDADDRWIDIPPEPTKFVVNFGDMLERWTNGRCKSTVHRVLTTGAADRYSIPCFIEPSFDAVVECLESCCSESNPSRWKPITVGNYLLQKHKATHADFAPEN